MALRIALVGCGKIADAHVEEIRKQPAAVLAAVCDREKLMAEQLATRYAVPAHYDDLDAMLDAEKPDVLHITTPPQAHLGIATHAIARGCHVFVEKPVAMSAAETRQLIAAAEGAGKKLTAGYRLLFDPAAVLARRVIQEGLLGDIVHAESFYGYDLSGPFGPAFVNNRSHWVHALPGKLFHNTIDHLLNKLPELIPDDRPVVRAHACSYSGLMAGDSPLLDELRVFVSGAKVSAYATFTSHTKPVQHALAVYGTRNTVRVDFNSCTVTFAPDVRLPGAIGRLVPPFGQARQFWGEAVRNVIRFARSQYHYFAGLNALIGLFYECVSTGGAPPIPYRDLLWVASTMDEVFRQTVHAGYLEQNA